MNQCETCNHRQSVHVYSNGSKKTGWTYAADAVRNGNQRCSLRPGPRYDGGFPSDLNVEAYEGTAAEEEDGKVAGADVEGGDHQDGSYGA